MTTKATTAAKKTTKKTTTTSSSKARARLTAPEVLARLEKLGKPQTLKTYARHAGGLDLGAFGVSFADIGKIRKEIGRDHDLALALWASGRLEVRIIATMVADPAQVTAALADRWVGEAGHWAVGNYLADLVARSEVADEAMKRWMRSRAEIEQVAGYGLLGSLLVGRTPPSEALCAKVLETIEREIHGAPNRARYAMNGALIAIGGYVPALRARALAAARRIGKVEVDHGDTDCKTPDAAEYIEKMAARQAQKTGKKAGKGA